MTKLVIAGAICCAGLCVSSVRSQPADLGKGQQVAMAAPAATQSSKPGGKSPPTTTRATTRPAFTPLEAKQAILDAMASSELLQRDWVRTARDELATRGFTAIKAPSGTYYVCGKWAVTPDGHVSLSNSRGRVIEGIEGWLVVHDGRLEFVEVAYYIV